MSKRSASFPILLAAVLMLGLPPVLLVLASAPEPASGPPASDDSPTAPVKRLIAQSSNLALLYEAWQRKYVAGGGDHRVVVGVGRARGITDGWSPAEGAVRLDLIAGKVTAEVAGLGGAAADLWLVQSAPDEGIRPTPGDRLVSVGRLRLAGGVARAAASFPPGFFRTFVPDLVAVSPAGRSPVESTLLVGTRPLFERVYTQARVETERRLAAERRPTLASWLRPSALASLFRPRAADANSTQILIAHGLVSQAVGNGGDLFFRGTFGGNGRTCGTCHRAENNLAIDAEFIATLPSSDKLFVASFPPEQGGVPGLERPELLRQFGLILENVDGAENPTVKFTMRGVPHSESMSVSILAPQDGRAPVQRPGWSGDGAPQTGALRFFAAGAVFQHFTKNLARREGIDFVSPTATQLDQMEAYQLATGRTNELNLAQVSLTNAAANNGRILFLDNAVAKCNRCHLNAGANIQIPPDTQPTNRNFDTGVETVTNPARAVENFPFDGGFGLAPKDCDGDLVNDCFGDGSFNTTPLIEAADTEPFFHSNVAATVEDSVRFYTTSNFTNSASGQFIGPIILTTQQINDVAAFLRVINASFNADIAVQRNNAALTLENSSSTSPCGTDFNEECTGGGDDVEGKRETVNTLLSLSNAESLDAVEVLEARALHSDAVTLFRSAIAKNNDAIASTSSKTRKSKISSALNDLKAAKAKFGTGLTLNMGDGNLLF